MASCSASYTHRTFGVPVAGFESFYVEKNGGEGSGVYRGIVYEIATRGHDVTAGAPGGAPPGTAAVVGYTEEWSSFGERYLRRLEIEVTDPANDLMVASYRVYRSPTMRVDAGTVIREAVDAVFGGE